MRPKFLKKNKKLQLKLSSNSEIYISLKLISTTKMSFDKPYWHIYVTHIEYYHYDAIQTSSDI
jgi:hypothetical protein